MAGEYKYSDTRTRGASRWLRLSKDGDSCRVVMILDDKDPDLGAAFYPRHWLKEQHKYVACTGDDCEHCAAKTERSWRMAITVFDLDAGERKVLDGFPNFWFEDLKDAISAVREAGRDPNIEVLKITRRGEKAQTRRNILPLGAVPDKKLAISICNLAPFTPEEMLGSDYHPKAEAGPSDEDAPPPPDEEPF